MGFSDEEEKYYGLDIYVLMFIGKKVLGMWCNLFEGKLVIWRKCCSGLKYYYWLNFD